MNNLSVIEIGPCDLEEIPENIGELINLQSFNLRGNKIKVLPNSFFTLTKLETILMSDNLIEEIPDSISGLISLKEGEFDDNLIKYVSDELMKLKNLEYFSVTNTNTNEIIVSEELKNFMNYEDGAWFKND